MSEKKQRHIVRKTPARPQEEPQKHDEPPPVTMFSGKRPWSPPAPDGGPIVSQFAPPPERIQPAAPAKLPKPTTLAGCFSQACQEIDPNQRAIGAQDLAAIFARLAELVEGMK